MLQWLRLFEQPRNGGSKPMMDDTVSLKNFTIAILGLGLMGGSIALALRGHCSRLIGIDPDSAALEMALRQNIVDQADTDPAKLLPQANLVILAAPVPVILTLLKQLPDFTPNPCIVMDLGSTKRAIVEEMNLLPPRFDPIGGHPICGKEQLTLANAERTLYYAAPFILTPLARTTPRARAAADQILAALGAVPIRLDPADHDRILASTSHLPYLLSSALALATPAETALLIGPGFRSSARLAGTPSSMMLGVLQSNRDNVIDALDRLQEQIARLKSALLLDDFASLEHTLDAARAHYQQLITGH
ncbi:MAG: prephenate dehydrogenase [Candidatus Villigracilaceae bacterium]